MRKPNPTTDGVLQGDKLSTADWKTAFSSVDFRNLDMYSLDHLHDVLDSSWQWFLRHQVVMSFFDVERYTRARRAIQNHVMRRI